MPNPLDERVVGVVLDFVNADSWPESKHIVESNRDILLSDVADLVFAVLLYEYRNDKELSRSIEEHRVLLARCRREGIEAAFAARLHSPEIPGVSPEVTDRLVSADSNEELEELLEEHPELLPALDQMMDEAAQYQALVGKLRSLLNELQRLTRLSDLPRRIAICHEALKLISRDDEPEAWAALHGDLGDSLFQNPLGDRAENLEQAIHHYQLALEVYTPEAFPAEWELVRRKLEQARRKYGNRRAATD